VIDGRARQLQEQPSPTPEKFQRNLTIIRKQTERITNIVRNLLNLSRPYHPRPTPVNAREVLAAVLEALETQIADASITVEQ
jgi:signal transduction histidine kinase